MNHAHIRPAVWLSLACVAAMLLACGGTAGTKRSAAMPRTSNEAVAEAVSVELAGDSGVPGHLIEVRASGGVVSLTGTVEDLLAKERSALIAETVRGVRAVVNRVAVKPGVDRSDAQIREEVLQALGEDPATERLELEVAVAGGQVQLSGGVDSWAERELVATVAKGVRGVVGVENRVDVEFKPQRADGEITGEIRQRMRWDALLDDGLIEVGVQGGRVRLSGTVGSAAEKRRALTDAYVVGVKSVDTTGLEVARWARDEDLRRDKYVVQDEAVRQAVMDALMYDPRVSGAPLRVRVKEGVATLSGTVGHARARQAAAQDARNTVGVVWVENKINVRPPPGLTDDEIEARVHRAIGRDPRLGIYDIDVDITGGLATLHGSVDSAYERSRTEELVSRVKGVAHVDNRLSVEGDDRLRYEPYTFDPFPYDFYWYRPTRRYTYKSDDRLAQDIRKRLRWSPFVSEQQVRVEVDNGRARLTGEVGSWGEYSAASNQAIEAGAVSVDNDLVVILERSP